MLTTAVLESCRRISMCLKAVRLRSLANEVLEVKVIDDTEFYYLDTVRSEDTAEICLT